MDGKDSTAFVKTTNGKAPNWELLDSKDSTESLGESAKAADSDKLDGKDSTSLQRPASGRSTRTEPTRSGYRTTGILTSSPCWSRRAATRSTRRSGLKTRTMTIPRPYIVNFTPGGNVVDEGTIEKLEENPKINAPDSIINISESYPLQTVVRDFGGGAIRINCSEGEFAFTKDSDQVDAFDGIITAIRVGTVRGICPLKLVDDVSGEIKQLVALRRRGRASTGR